MVHLAVKLKEAEQLVKVDSANSKGSTAMASTTPGINIDRGVIGMKRKINMQTESWDLVLIWAVG